MQNAWCVDASSYWSLTTTTEILKKEQCIRREQLDNFPDVSQAVKLVSLPLLYPFHYFLLGLRVNPD